MTLTKDHIAEIESFVRRKGIEYLDVQMEIIDHVASAVEEKLSSEPTLTFDEALKKAHLSFGIFGFSGMEDSIAKALGKKYNRIFWKQFRTLFGPKYLLLIFLFGFLAYKFYEWTEIDQNMVAIFLLATIMMVGLVVLFSLRFRGYNNLMVYRTSASYVMFLGPFAQVFNFMAHQISSADIFGANLNWLVSAFILALFTVYVIAAIKTVLKGIEESKLLIEKYRLIEN